MKHLLTSILLVCFAIGCAFKKDPTEEKIGTNKPTASPTQLVFNAVKSASFEEVKSLIDSNLIAEVATAEEDGQTLLEAALVRGNPRIVGFLLARGASAYIKGSGSHKKPYQLIRDYSQESGVAIGAWTMRQYQNLSTYGTLESAWTHFQKINLECSDLLQVHSFISVFSNLYSNTVLGLAESYCQDSLNNQNFKDWMLGEIISLSRHPNGNLDYLKFLLSRKNINNLQVELQVPGGKLIGTPLAFIKLALLSKDLAPQHTQLLKAAELLSQTRDYIAFKGSENLLPDSRLFFKERLTEQESEELINKYIMGTGLMGLRNNPLCLTGCHTPPHLLDEYN